MSTKIERKFEKRSLMREKGNLLLFLSGKSISLFGSAIYTFAIGLYLLKTTGSGLTFATNIVLYTVPMVIINPLAGVIADRINKKIMVVGSDLLNGVFLIGVYLMAGRIGLSVPLVYISTFVMTVLTAFFDIGIESAKPNLVSERKLVDINSLARVIESGSHILGPMLGGLVYAIFDMRLFILVNAISYIVGAVLEYFIDYHYNRANEKDKNEESQGLEQELKKSLWKEMKEGYRYIVERSHMKALIYIFIALNFFFNFSIIVPLPYLLNNIWKVDSSIYGIVQGGLPIGMIIGALLVKKVMARTSYTKLLKKINYSVLLLVLVFMLPMIVSSTVPTQIFILIYYTIAMIIGGLIVAWVDVPMNILIQKIVPGEILGRVISVRLSIIKIIVPIALLLSGYLLNYISPFYIFLMGISIFGIFNIWFFGSTPGQEFVNLSNSNLTKGN